MFIWRMKVGTSTNDEDMCHIDSATTYTILKSITLFILLHIYFFNTQFCPDYNVFFLFSHNLILLLLFFFFSSYFTFFFILSFYYYSIFILVYFILMFYFILLLFFFRFNLILFIFSLFTIFFIFLSYFLLFKKKNEMKKREKTKRFT